VLVVGDLPMGFLGLWCHIVAEVVDGFHTLVVVGIGGVVFGCVAEVEVVGWVVLVMRLLEQRLLPLLLLAKDLDSVLELRESCPFSIDVLPSGFGTLSCCMPPCNGFLFLTKPLDLLLDSSQLLLFCSFVFESLFFPIFHLNLLELCVVLDDLNQ
jgi:hypothetical protein